MVVVYGAESGKTDQINAYDNEVDGTYASGAAITAAAYGGSGDAIKAGPIGTVRYRGGSIRRAGMVPIGRGIGESHGLIIEGYGSSGGSIDKVLLDGISISDGRNAFVFVRGSGTNKLVMKNMEFDNQAAVGTAANSPDSGPLGVGHQTSPTNNGVIDVSAAAVLVQVNCTLDGVPLANLPPAAAAASRTYTAKATDAYGRANGTLGTTETGSLAYSTASTAMSIASNKAKPPAGSSYPTELVNAGSANVRFAVDVTVGGTPCYIFVGSGSNAGGGIVLVTNQDANLYADPTGGTATTNGRFASGTHRMMIEQFGNDVKAYIDGTYVGGFTKTGSAGSGTFVGYGVYGTADGTEAFDNMSLDIVSQGGGSG